MDYVARSVVLLVCVWLMACGEQSTQNDEAGMAQSPVRQHTGAQVEEVPTLALEDAGVAPSAQTFDTRLVSEGRTTTQASEPPDALADRKVIYNATVDLIVDDFSPVSSTIRSMVKKHGGFVASSNITGSAGQSRLGTWTIRVPVGNYDAMLAEAEGLGQVREISSTSREVTAEYVDLQARIKSKLLEEQRLQAHLESAIKLEDILLVERELTRVRGEIERLQGQMNILADLTALSTVTLQVQEIENYIPSINEEPAVATQLGRAWSGSVSSLKSFLIGTTVVLVSVTPWLIVTIPVALVAYLGLARRRKHAKASA